MKDVERVDVDGGESETVRLHHSFSSWGRYVVRVNDRRAGTVVVVKDLDDGSQESTNSTASNGTGSTPATTTTMGTPGTPTSTLAPTTSENDPVDSSTPTGRKSTPTGSPTGTSVQTATLSAPPSELATAEPTTVRSSGQPGFGVVLGVLALIATGLVRRRRQ